MARIELDLPPAVTTPAMSSEGAPRTFRGRLFRKYLLLILVLVGGALLTSGAVSIYFGYQENKAAIGALQNEKAVGAASRIAAVHRSDHAAACLRLAAADRCERPRDAPHRVPEAPAAGAGGDRHRAARLDGPRGDRRVAPRHGSAQLAGRSLAGAGVHQRKRGKPWYSPVYFRKDTEPYMTVSLRAGGERGPVTIADVNLKFIWDVVSRIKIGDKGKAYVVDRSGYLVADPDIGLVLRKTDLSHLPHVKAAAAGPPLPDEPALKSVDLAGTPVLVSWSPSNRSAGTCSSSSRSPRSTRDSTPRSCGRRCCCSPAS